LEKCGFATIGEETDVRDSSGEQIEEYVLKLGAEEQEP
jgi:hypothetical protein